MGYAAKRGKNKTTMSAEELQNLNFTKERCQQHSKYGKIAYIAQQDENPTINNLHRVIRLFAKQVPIGQAVYDVKISYSVSRAAQGSTGTPRFQIILLQGNHKPMSGAEGKWNTKFCELIKGKIDIEGYTFCIRRGSAQSTTRRS